MIHTLRAFIASQERAYALLPKRLILVLNFSKADSRHLCTTLRMLILLIHCLLILICGPLNILMSRFWSTIVDTILSDLGDSPAYFEIHFLVNEFVMRVNQQTCIIPTIFLVYQVIHVLARVVVVLFVCQGQHVSWHRLYPISIFD